MNVSDLTLVKPITIYAIQEKIIEFMKARSELDESAAESLEAAPVQAEIIAEPQTVADKKMTGKPGNERKHILVVDDNSLMLKVIKEHLRNEYDVATAINGKIALRFLEKKKTDLILLDYEMPGEDGPTILGKLRQIDSVKDVPVIFLTGISEKDKIRKALSMKPQGYLLKPIERQALLEAIHKYLD